MSELLVIPQHWTLILAHFKQNTCVWYEVWYLKFLSDLGSVQEQPGAETVHWSKVSWR